MGGEDIHREQSDRRGFSQDIWDVNDNPVTIWV